MKKLTFIFCLIAILFAVTFTAGASNKMYRTLPEETSLMKKDGKAYKPILGVMKGDTVYATQETHAFISEKDGQRVDKIPVEYKGVKGWIEVDNIYPVKSTPEDTLSYTSFSALDKRSPIERFGASAIEWAMNKTETLNTWFYALFIALGVAFLFSLLSTAHRYLRFPALLLAGVALAAASASEIMYILSFHDHLLWFLEPSKAGGWLRVILNFLLLCITLLAQVGMFYGLWTWSFDDSLSFKTKSAETDTPSWIEMLAFYPVALGIIMLIMYGVDVFKDNSWPAMPYLVALATLIIPAICGMVYQFTQMRWFHGLVFPVLYIASAPGIVMTVFVLSMVIVLVIIVGIVLAIGVAIVGSLIGGLLFGKERVTGYTSDGRKVTGYRNYDGTVSGDDGNTYTYK